MDRRRIILLILFTIFVIGMGYLLWRVFFASNDTPTIPRPGGGTTSTSTATSTFPNAGIGGDRGATDGSTTSTPPVAGGSQTPGDTENETVVGNSRVDAVRISSTGLLRFYNQQDGKFYGTAADGTLSPLSEETFFQAQQITWSPVADKAIVEYPDGSNIFYDFETKKQVTLPKHWENFSFAPQGDKIAAKSMTLAPENRYVITANPDGQEVRLVEPMGSNADLVEIDWSPNKDILGFSKTGRSLGSDRQEILLVGQYGENFKSLVVEGRGYESTWSTDGSKVLYSVYSARNDYKPELWIVSATGDSIGEDRTLLNVNTWVDKCTFQDSRYVYCGVPESLSKGAGFAPQIADNTVDRIVRIDTQTGSQKEIRTSQTFVVDSLAVSPDGKTLYITDKQSDRLTQISL